ncbi:MAG: hypothetical protein BHW01_00950 [Clostridium sp. 27_14]|nr:MAG: hypothetical protein BHW01_00950 [Clostridium sp. 27_14]
MGNIVLLDDLTINKIAAGEVIERPASVIKEMVENSIDAGATNIVVEIKNGGISFIKITDNGKGIAQDDLEIAFERHATSKIRSADDLDTVTSMGFRGEALASIAAISNVELISKTQQQENGYKVVVEAGDILEKEIAPSSVGTSITVKNLFFNTPVRYKFLKKDYTESGYIEDVITRIALVNPQIAFKLINNGKTVIQTNGNGDMKTVVYSIYGKTVAESISPVSYTYEDIKVDGVIGKPEIARSNRSNQLFFVNKRYVRDKVLTSATEQAYKGMIPLGKFGFVILNITIAPARVDVNVHPAKLEVRFQEENKIFQAIYHAIKDTLLKNEDKDGLFGNRNTNEKQIEEYTKRESEIKTNAQEKTYAFESNTINTTNRLKENKNTNINTNGLINTQEILEKLKKLKEDIQNETLTNIQNETNKAEKNVEKIENLQEEKEQNKIENQQLEKEQEENKEEAKETNEQETKQQEEKMRKTEKTNENVEQQEPISVSQVIEKAIQQNEVSPQSIEQLMQEYRKMEKEVENENTENNNGNQDTEDRLEDSNPNSKLSFDEMYQKLFGTLPVKSEEEKNEEKEADENNAVDIIKNNISMFEDIPECKKQPYKFIGIVFNTYIIIEMEKEMYIIDQHAAHERILYEKVKKNYYSESTKDSQMLLLPDIITLTHKEMDIAKENMDMFRKAGFDLDEFGENTIRLTGVPTICMNIDNKDLFLETLDEINTVARTAKQEKEEKFIATVACKAAVKANMVLSVDEVHSLLDEMLELPNPFSCPHGRPTAIKMSKYDIERKFARK